MTTRKLGSIKLTDNVLIPNVALGSEVTGILGVANGGTGQSVYTDGQLLIGNTTGNTLTKATLTAGNGIAVTNGNGSISLATTAAQTHVTSVGTLTGLSVGGDITLTTGANRTIQIGSSTNYYWRLRSVSDDFQIIAGADQQTAMTFKYSTWNVGIGTTSPGARLDVNTGTSALVQQWQGAGTNFTLRLATGNGASANASIYKLYSDYLNGTNINSYIEFFRGSAGNDGFLTFGTQNTERMRIDAAGNLAVDTNTLYVDAANNLVGIGATPSTLVYTGNSGVASKAQIVATDNTTTLNLTTAALVIQNESTTNDTGAALNFVSRNTGNTIVAHAAIYGLTGTRNAGWNTGSLIFATGNASAAPTERMRIDASGNVGIGVANPGFKLDVGARVRLRSDGSVSAGHWLTDSAGTNNVFTGLLGASSTDSWGVYSNAAWQFVIRNGGDIGVGTTVPGARFHVFNGDIMRTNSDYVNGSAGSGFVITHVASSGATDALLYAFRGGNTSYGNIVIPGGNVGIGTTSPGNYRLNVSKGAAGDVAQFTDGVAHTFVIRTDASTLFVGQANNFPLVLVTNNTEKVRITAAGNVGIGTASPSQPLHVNGNATAADFILTSDRRLKRDLVGITNALSTVLSWAGYTYRPIDSERRRAGLMAQDVEMNAPEVVYTDADGWKSMSYEQTIPYLVEAIRDLYTLIEARA